MLINEGVQIYMSRTIPVIMLFLVSAGGYVFVTAGWGTLTCFGAGALLNLLSAWVGVRTTVQGTCRLATLLGENLSRSVQLGMWTGSIGGLLSTSLALGGPLLSVSFHAQSTFALSSNLADSTLRLWPQAWQECGSGYWTPPCSRASARALAWSPSTCGLAAGSSPRVQTSAPRQKICSFTFRLNPERTHRNTAEWPREPMEGCLAQTRWAWLKPLAEGHYAQIPCKAIRTKMITFCLLGWRCGLLSLLVAFVSKCTVRYWAGVAGESCQILRMLGVPNDHPKDKAYDKFGFQNVSFV